MAKVLQVYEVPIIEVSTMCFPIHAGTNFGGTLDKKFLYFQGSHQQATNFPAEKSQFVSPITLKQTVLKKC
jgi:hypothetical protein